MNKLSYSLARVSFLSLFCCFSLLLFGQIKLNLDETKTALSGYDPVTYFESNPIDWNSLKTFHLKMAQPLNSKIYLEKNKNIQTVSITSLKKSTAKQELTYIDLCNSYSRKNKYSPEI